jgi:hypothetical protein
MSAPKTLHEIELWMVSAITGAEVDAASPERVVTAGPRMSAAERLDVYRLAYKARLVECLLDDYPVLAKLLGRETFDELARAYVDRHPSSSPNLNFFGRHMASFLRETSVAGLEPVRAFASELATLEWALVEVLHAEVAPPLDLAELQGLPPEAWATARLVVAEGVRLFRFEHPVNAFFQRVMADEDLPAVPGPAPSAVVVYRKELAIWRMDLTPAMTRVLAPIFAKRTIGEALAELEAHGDPAELEEAARSLSAWFSEWTLAGLFTRVERTSRD